MHSLARRRPFQAWPSSWKKLGVDRRPSRWLDAWLGRARWLLADAKRLEVGDVHIGQHAPAEVDGTLSHGAVREAIQRIGSSDLEDDPATELMNSAVLRPADCWTVGRKERVLAASWNERADRVRDSWPRVAAIFDRDCPLVSSRRARARRNQRAFARVPTGSDALAGASRTNGPARYIDAGWSGKPLLG